jgi:anaerobic selenocysteine-containing dehydrogenase
MTEARTVHRICTLCEATCGISVTVDSRGTIASIRGDESDPFSRGYICPKAYGLKGLHEDPDRLRRPLRRSPRGGWEEISWDAAYEYAAERLLAIRERHGANAIATYIGNPTAHNLHTMLYLPVFNRALGTKQRYSASTVDQFPKMVSAGLMFGDGLTVPVPDLDRTEYLLVLGANPLASNGSLMTAPDVKKRLRDIVRRGGKIVVVDPRRSETAEVATEHLFIRPGTDAYLLLAMVNTLFAEDLIRLGRAEGHVEGLDAVRTACAGITPETVAERCGIAAPVIRRLTREFAHAERAACYGRIGTTCQEFGTLASWAVDLLNVLTGKLDREGGAMFARAATTPAASSDEPGGRGVTLHRWKSRVRGLPEIFGELPVATLADEIETPGEGAIRALVTVAGNPVVSTPHAGRLDRALASLELMISIDFYINETTRHAHLILPPTSALEHDTYDLALYRLAVRDVAKYSAPVFQKAEGAQHDWEILATLSAYMLGFGRLPAGAVDDFVLRQLVDKAIPEDGSRSNGKSRDEVMAALGSDPGPHRALDLMLRTGPYGEGFGMRPDGLSLDKLRENPHGIDLGALKPQLPGILETPSGKIDLAPKLILDDLPRLRTRLLEAPPPMVLIGRRHLRSNNSWCHNIESLVKGPARCTLLVNAEDARRRGLRHGGVARVSSRVGSVVAPVEVSDEVMPGVVSLPHGWGHGVEGVRMSVAQRHPGVNSNLLADDLLLDVPSGNAALNGIPVRVEAVS